MPIEPFQMFSIVCDVAGYPEGIEVHPADLDKESVWGARDYAQEHEGWRFAGVLAFCPNHQNPDVIKAAIKDAKKTWFKD